jgi:hypothetical protein
MLMVAYGAGLRARPRVGSTRYLGALDLRDPIAMLEDASL